VHHEEPKSNGPAIPKISIMATGGVRRSSTSSLSRRARRPRLTGWHGVVPCLEVMFFGHVLGTQMYGGAYQGGGPPGNLHAVPRI